MLNFFLIFSADWFTFTTNASTPMIISFRTPLLPYLSLYNKRSMNTYIDQIMKYRQVYHNTTCTKNCKVSIMIFKEKIILKTFDEFIVWVFVSFNSILSIYKPSNQCFGIYRMHTNTAVLVPVSDWQIILLFGTVLIVIT